jgi:DNA-3-methyladenine glycosylase
MELTKEFFLRDVETVAKELLGKVIVRKMGDSKLLGRIVETEAYYGEDDPASWARFNGEYRRIMKMEHGTILVKMVHNNFLLNIVTGNIGEARAVLIRAIEPLNFDSKGNGPGLLTKALKIDKKFHKQNIVGNKEIWVEDDVIDEKKDFEIIESFRIGVVKDLGIPLRYYIKDNKHVSKK